MILVQNDLAPHQAEDFATVASSLLKKLTNDTVSALNMQKQLVDAGQEINPKMVVYIVAHGCPDSIVNYSSGTELGAKLGGLGITNKNTTSVVLVSCSTGDQSTTGNLKNFAQQLTEYLKTDVYAATDLISVHYNTTTSLGQKVLTPDYFSVKGIKVNVVNGEGLTRFTSDGEGYIPPKV